MSRFLLGCILASFLFGCGTREYQPPKDSIPPIPKGRTSGMDDLQPPTK